jgi:hypothetical protein
MYKLQRLAFWKMKSFVRSLMWITITSNLLVTAPPPFLCIVVDCHEDYMPIMYLGDETYAKPIWVAKALSKSNFVTSLMDLGRVLPTRVVFSQGP